MSYHILHQFDEQWLADLKQEAGDHGRRFSDSLPAEHGAGRGGKLIERETNRWIIVAASILMATFALLFSIDASHRAEVLQQRLEAIEQAVKK